jgi:hypothetical protein
MRNCARFASVLFSIAAILATSRASADIAPADPAPCIGKTVGAPCMTSGTSGSCRDETCTNASGSYQCLECVAGVSPDPSTSSDDGWCSVSKGSPANHTGPWLMGGALALVFLFVGRRKRQ